MILTVLYWLIAASIASSIGFGLIASINEGLISSLLILVFSIIAGAAWPFTLVIILCIIIVQGEKSTTKSLE